MALLTRGSSGLDAATEDVNAAGGEALPISVDVADAEDLEAAAERVERVTQPARTNTWSGCLA